MTLRAKKEMMDSLLDSLCEEADLAPIQVSGLFVIVHKLPDDGGFIQAGATLLAGSADAIAVLYGAVEAVQRKAFQNGDFQTGEALEEVKDKMVEMFNVGKREASGPT